MYGEVARGNEEMKLGRTWQTGKARQSEAEKAGRRHEKGSTIVFMGAEALTALSGLHDGCGVRKSISQVMGVEGA